MFISFMWERYKTQDISKLYFPDSGISNPECFQSYQSCTRQFPAVPLLMTAGPWALYKAHTGSETSAGVVMGGYRSAQLNRILFVQHRIEHLIILVMEISLLREKKKKYYNSDTLF